MKQTLKRLFAGTVTAAMLFGLTLPAAAAEPFGAPPGPPPGGGAGSAGQEFATFSEILEHAAITPDQLAEGLSGSADFAPAPGSDFSGLMQISGAVSATGADGVMIEGDGNGIAISNAAETDVFTIGGSDLNYEVDGRQYNSVIKVNAGEVNNDAGYEAVSGVAAAIETGELRIENSYLASDGPRSSPVYAFSTAAPAATSVVAVNSKLVAHSDSIWMPPFKLLAGGARATLLMTRNNSWFYGSEVESNNWGAISQDSVDAMTYVVNSSGISTQGGYGTYLTYGMRLYGSDLYAGQYGVFMCGTSDILTDTGAFAVSDEDAMSKAPDFQVDEGRISTVAAPCNAVVVHNSLPNLDMVAKGVFRNSVVSTMEEDLPASVTPMKADDEFFMPGVDILGSGAGCGASYFFSRNLYGSLVLVRSMNGDFTFDNTETRTSNNVLLQSVVTYDPPSASGYLTPEQGAEVPGIAGTFLNGEYTGDILHQDYQRPMTVTVGEGAVLKGSAVSGTWAGWNDLWTEENLTAALTEDGYSPDFFNNPQWVEDVQTNLVRSEDSVYDGTENHGISMTVAKGGSWVITGNSTLKTLTIEEGAEVSVPNGCELECYVNCDTSNSLLSYDASTGEALADLAPGTYTGVVLTVTGEPIPEPEEAETETEVSAEEPSLIAEASAEEPSLIAEASAAEEAQGTETAEAAAQPENNNAKIPAAMLGATVIALLVGRTLALRKKRKGD